MSSSVLFMRKRSFCCIDVLFSAPHWKIHQIIQAIQLTVIHPLLGYNSMSVQEASGLRLIAAKVLAEFLSIFSGSETGYLGVGGTIINLYAKVLYDTNQPMTSILGAIVVRFRDDNIYHFTPYIVIY